MLRRSKNMVDTKLMTKEFKGVAINTIKLNSLRELKTPDLK